MDTNVSKLQEIVEDRGAWHAAVHAAAKVRHNLVAEQQQQRRPHVRRGKGGMRWGEKEHARLSRVAGLSPPTRQPPREAGAASACSDKDKEGGGELLGPTQVVPAERAREMRVPLPVQFSVLCPHRASSDLCSDQLMARRVPAHP